MCLYRSDFVLIVAYILKVRCNVFLSTYTIRYVSVVISLGNTWTVGTQHVFEL